MVNAFVSMVGGGISIGDECRGKAEQYARERVD